MEEAEGGLQANRKNCSHYGRMEEPISEAKKGVETVSWRPTIALIKAKRRRDLIAEQNAQCLEVMNRRHAFMTAQAIAIPGISNLPQRILDPFKRLQDVLP